MRVFCYNRFMNLPWRLAFRRVGEMALIVAIGGAFGLAANRIAKKPLPLWTPLPDRQEQREPLAQVVKDLPRSSLPTVDCDTLRQLRDDPSTLVLDARLDAAYRQGHIPGAVSLPVVEFFVKFADLRARIAAAGLVIVYCIDPACPDGRSLGDLLQAQGIRKVMLFDGGIEEWRRRGYELAVE